MNKQENQTLFDSLEAYSKNTSNKFKVDLFSRGPLEKFHQWADGKPSIGTFKVKVDDKEPYYLFLCNWIREKLDKFYMVVYPNSKSVPIAELWEMENGFLTWTYRPNKRGADKNDSKLINENLKELFKEQYGDLKTKFKIPVSTQETDNFLKEIIDLVELRRNIEKEYKNNNKGSGNKNSLNIWMEKTECKGRPHRLSGEFRFGKVLWSPQIDKGGKDIYKNMRKVKAGDLVIHLIDNEGIKGISKVSKPARDDLFGPKGSKWEDRQIYSIELESFVDLEPIFHRRDFLGNRNYQEAFRDIRKKSKGLFYQDNLDLRQGAYITNIPKDLFNLFNEAYKDHSGKNLPFFELIILPKKDPNGKGKQPMDLELPLNLILYGPPGTGKTYRAVDKAVEILDPDFLKQHFDDRQKIKQRFDELRDEERIALVTFHQSFSYEDFVEGIKAFSNEDNQISYDIEDGIFKRICETASSTVEISTDSGLSLDGRRIWKMSLGNTRGDDAYIYEECIQKKYILMGYGRGVDFSDRNTRGDILKAYIESGDNKNINDYDISATYQFNSMKAGDIVVVSDGNHKFRAIGEVKSDVRLLNDVGRDIYLQCRDVTWLRAYNPSRSIDELFDKILSQQTIYELKSPTIRMDALVRLLSNEDNEKGQKPYVLIIDEINRGNISRIFGELITLIEPSKRAGAAESLSARLPYSKTRFSVPDNLYIIGTMNTADRSLALMDTALRRRFTFEELMPDPQSLEGVEIEGINLSRMLKAINGRIELIYDREHTLGHTYFLPLKDAPNISLLSDIFRRQVLPLLQEYFFEDWEKIRHVLGDPNKPKELAFVVPRFSDNQKTDLFGSDNEDLVLQSAYELNLSAFGKPDAYKSIYQPKKDE